LSNRYGSKVDSIGRNSETTKGRSMKPRAATRERHY